MADAIPIPHLEVSLSGGYYFGQLERLIKQLEPLTHLDAVSAGPDLRLHIYLGGVAFIGPLPSGGKRSRSVSST